MHSKKQKNQLRQSNINIATKKGCKSSNKIPTYHPKASRKRQEKGIPKLEKVKFFLGMFAVYIGKMFRKNGGLVGYLGGGFKYFIFTPT